MPVDGEAAIRERRFGADPVRGGLLMLTRHSSIVADGRCRLLSVCPTRLRASSLASDSARLSVRCRSRARVERTAQTPCRHVPSLGDSPRQRPGSERWSGATRTTSVARCAFESWMRDARPLPTLRPRRSVADRSHSCVAPAIASWGHRVPGRCSANDELRLERWVRECDGPLRTRGRADDVPPSHDREDG